MHLPTTFPSIFGAVCSYLCRPRFEASDYATVDKRQHVIFSRLLLLPEPLVARITEFRSKVDCIGFRNQSQDSEMLSLVRDNGHLGFSKSVGPKSLFPNDGVPGGNCDGLRELDSDSYRESAEVWERKKMGISYFGL